MSTATELEQAPDAAEVFARTEATLPVEEYNFEHFRTRHLLTDLEGTATTRGIQPGELAPDFELPTADGGTLRLSDLRGEVVLLHFGSAT